MNHEEFQKELDELVQSAINMFACAKTSAELEDCKALAYKPIKQMEAALWPKKTKQLK